MCGEDSKEPSRKRQRLRFPCIPLLAGFLLAWRERTKYAKESDYVFSERKAERQEAAVRRSIWCQKYLRPAAISAGVIPANWKGRFGFHNFRHSLADGTGEAEVDPKPCRCAPARGLWETMGLYAQSDMESMRDAQGKFSNS